MGSGKASNFSIDHIMGFASQGKSSSTSTANATVSSWTDINSTGDLCTKSEIYCDSYPVSQKPSAPPHSYPWEPVHPTLYCRNNYVDYASFNYYPLDFGRGSFQNGAGPHIQCVYLPTVDNPRKRHRMRTVFTDNQTQKLEHLFGVTDYPATEAREELALKTGLSAETVRVWFKNRRARRRRQGIGKGKTSSYVKCVKRDSPGNDEKASL